MGGAHRAEAGLVEHRSEAGRAGLRPESEPDVLRAGVWEAEHGRTGVVQTADEPDVVLDRVSGIRLHDQQRPVVRQRPERMPRGADRVAQVVERVEEADQVVAGTRERACLGAPELDPIRDTCGLRLCACRHDGGVVGVEADEAGALERLRHQHRRVPMPAADVRHGRPPLEPLDDAVERGQPLRHERRPVGVGVDRGDAAVEPSVVLSPGNAGPRAKRVERALLVEPHRPGDLERGGEEDRALLVDEHRHVLGRELVRL